MLSLRHLLVAPLTLLALPSICCAQQELFVLADDERIVEYVGYDSPTPTPVLVTSWTLDDATLTPTGLVVDSATGDFIVLASNLAGHPAGVSRLYRVARANGVTTLLCTLPFGWVDGLDMRSEGELFAIHRGDALLRIDLAACTWTSTPISVPTVAQWWAGAVDRDGTYLLADYGATLATIDPIDGTSTAVGSVPVLTKGIERDADGRLYMSDHWGALNVFDPASGQTSQLVAGFGLVLTGHALALSQAVDGNGVLPVCDGAPNSTGASSTLELLGTTVAAANAFELYTRQLPTHSFGYYLMGPNVGMQAVGQGVLCIAVPQSRFSLFVQDSGALGIVRFPVDLSSLPNGSPALAGDRYVFQYWHRDVGPTSNLSAASAFTFQ